MEAKSGASPVAPFGPRPLLFWGLVSSALVLFVAERARIGLARPVPWPDEGSFLFPALAFRDGFSFFAPEINPTRQVLWMPPGFMVLEGTIFKLLPFSLDAARTLSALFLSGAFACLAATFRRFRSALALTALLPVFLFSPIFEIVGNVARMEALVLLIATAGFLLLSQRRTVGLALLAFGPLVHPNGLFPLVFGALHLLIVTRGRPRFSRSTFIVLALVALAWALYGVYVSAHFPAFREDMLNQIRFKQFISQEDGGPLVRARLPVVLLPSLLLSTAVLVSRRVGAPVGALATLAAAFIAQTLIASGWLYEIYIGFAILVVAVVTLETVAVVIDRRQPSRRVAWSALALATCVLAFAGRLAVRSAFVERSLVRSTVSRTGVEPPYFTAEDDRVVGDYLASLARQAPISVQLVPDGEALLFERLRGPRIRFVQQTFFVGRFDVAVIHDSAWLPRYVHDLEYLNVLWLHELKPPRTTVIRTRNGSEIWTVLKWPTASVVGAP